MIRPAITYSYDIAGRSLCVSASDHWAAAVTRNFLRDFRLDPVTIPTPPHYTIHISSDALPPTVPSNLETFEVAHGHCSTDAERYYLAVEDSLIIADPVDSLSVWIGNTPHARQPLPLVNVLGYALDIALRRSGLYQLHGGGVAPPGQKSAALILGSSGSGKSTLTSLLASRGWSYMTDDALLLNEEKNTVIARGIRRFFAASEAALASCSLLHLSEAVGDTMLSDPNKRRLEPSVAFPGGYVDSCLPRTLFFASVSADEESTLLPVAQVEAMSRLIRSNPWASYDRFTARDHLRVLNLLATQCDAYLFRGGRDVLSDPSLAERMFLPLIGKPARQAAK